MKYRFRLRVLLAIVTAIAVGLGGNLAANRLIGIRPDAADPVWLILRGIGNTPLLVACAVGVLLILDWHGSKRPASRLAIIALIVMAMWTFAAPLANTAYYASHPSVETLKWYGVLYPIFSSLVDATCWSLMIAALLCAFRDVKS